MDSTRQDSSSLYYCGPISRLEQSFFFSLQEMEASADRVSRAIETARARVEDLIVDLGEAPMGNKEECRRLKNELRARDLMEASRPPPARMESAQASAKTENASSSGELARRGNCTARLARNLWKGLKWAYRQTVKAGLNRLLGLFRRIT